MRSIVMAIIIGLGILAGCSQNEITIRNSAQGAIQFHFRGEVYPVAAGNTSVIDEIPNGSYGYSSVVSIPPGATQWEPGPGLSGTFSFLKGQTTIEIQYISFMPDTVYQVDAVYSTSDRMTGMVDLGSN